jgi:hypothetical protein
MTTGARRGRALHRYVLPMLVIAVLGLLVSGVSPANASGRGLQTSQHTSATSLLAAKWWQWALTQPGSKSPLTDTTGQFCRQGQRGDVWFLAGNFGGQPVSPINRSSCTIPGGKDLFFPLVNSFSGYQVSGGSRSTNGGERDRPARHRGRKSGAGIDGTFGDG